MTSGAEMIKPGEGVTVEQVEIGPIRQKLQEGAYDLEQLGLDELRDALGNLATAPPDTPARKGFRNAYASLVCERAWPGYERLCVDSVHTMTFDASGRSSLEPIDGKKLASMTPSEVVETLACANESTLTHFICQQFVGGKIPTVSGDRDTNEAYFEALRMQTDLGMFAGVRFDDRLPDAAGTPSKFISAGTRTLRTHIFPVATLIDELTERDGFRLSNVQHRASFLRCVRRSITPYYSPTVPVAVESSDLLIDPDASINRLNPDAWTYSGGPDDLFVYPVPEMIANANERFSCKPSLPPQTGCPFFHGSTPLPNVPERRAPLPRSLPQLTVGQLDKWYYPVRDV